MHPVILNALARAKADDIVRRSEQRAVRASLATRPKRPQPVEAHRYTLPKVVEVPRVVAPENLDDSVW